MSQSEEMLNGKCKMVNGDCKTRISQIEAKLEDTIELLHLWKNEALAYRKLAEAMVEGEVTRETARLALALADSKKIEELGGKVSPRSAPRHGEESRRNAGNRGCV